MNPQSRLQSLHDTGHSLRSLCNVVTEEVFELTIYDRVMTYRFHDDDHGEVFTETTKPGLEPYLGLHYPATDIPQTARFLFMKTKVRMICDCRAKPVKILQDDSLPFDITFCGSTLRAPHSCHLQYMENMNSIASLVMAVVITEPPTYPMMLTLTSTTLSSPESDSGDSSSVTTRGRDGGEEGRRREGRRRRRHG